MPIKKQQRQLWTEQEVWKSIIDQVTIAGNRERDYTLSKLTSQLLGILNGFLFGTNEFSIKSGQVKEYLRIKFVDKIYVKDKRIFLKGVEYLSVNVSKICNDLIKPKVI